MQQFLEFATCSVFGRPGGHDEYRSLVPPAGPHLLVLSQPASPGRADVERFVAAAYERAFGARLTQFYPSMLELRLDDNCLLGAAGIRAAQNQRLFVEHYLPRPVQYMIADHVGPVPRAAVVEIGNLAVADSESTHAFFSLIGRWVQHFGIEWITFALTRPLQRLFGRAGVSLLDFGPADPGKLPAGTDDWGRYYARGPRVMAVPVRDGLAQFHRSHGHCPYSRLQTRTVAP